MKGKCSDCKVCHAYINETENRKETSKPAVQPECAVARKNRTASALP